MRGPAPRPPGMRIMSGPVGASSRTLVLYGNMYHISRGAFTSLARARPRDVRATAARNGCPLPCALKRRRRCLIGCTENSLFFRTEHGLCSRPPRAARRIRISRRPYTGDSRTSYYLGGCMPEPDAGRSRWQERFDQPAQRDADFTTLSGVEVDPFYGPPPGAVVPDLERIGWPGEFPFPRGIHASGYRGKPWTIRQFSGFGNARQTNERYKMLLAAGGAGLSVAFDMPTLMGRDSDDPRSLGEVGHCGVAIDSAA